MLIWWDPIVVLARVIAHHKIRPVAVKDTVHVDSVATPDA